MKASIFASQLSLTILLVFLFNCTSAYIRDRANDLSDIAGVSIDASLGASASIGPVTAGVIAAQSFARARNGTACYSFGNIFERFFYALIRFSTVQCNEVQGTLLIGWRNDTLLHSSFSTGDEIDRGKEYGNETRSQAFQFGRLRIRAGLGLGASIELNWLEAIDFVSGFFGIDLLNDDIHTKTLHLYELRKKRIFEDVKEIDSQILKKETFQKHCKRGAGPLPIVSLYSFEGRIIKYEKREKIGDKEFFTQYYYTYPETLLFLQLQESELNGSENRTERKLYFKDGLPFLEEYDPETSSKETNSNPFSKQNWTEFSAKKDFEKACSMRK
ncbi:hypothetical protein EHQ32_17910 [Leptospira wolffii]|nr:hypothetical protein EHQ32_17910 [Leptospira wolffii]